MSRDLNAHFRSEMDSGDPEWPIIANLLWERLTIVERLLLRVEWSVVDDNELPPDLADRR